MAGVIAAAATAAAVSAIGIIRLSGDGAAQLAGLIFDARSGVSLVDAEPNKLIRGALRGVDGAVIDHCLAVVARAPRSYTGEDTVEFHCHGSPAVLTEGLKALFKAGARQAAPGEFTKRAFLNGKMDLAQAEAVIDVIHAEGPEQLKNAAAQLDGVLSRKISQVYDALLEISAHFQAIIDYPDEDIDEFSIAAALKTIRECEAELKRLVKSFDRGIILRDGIKCAIIGKPNVGKSSLMNALAGYDRVIVTPHAGTTRDTVEESVRLGGVVLRLIDTAGLRYTIDDIEILGINRARDVAEEAGLVFTLFDGSRELDEDDASVIAITSDRENVIAIVNKRDLETVADVERLKAAYGSVCSVSAKNSEGLDALDGAVRRIIGENAPEPDGSILTNPRQFDAVNRALESLSSAREAMERGITPDAVLTDTEDAMSALGELLGKTVREDIVSTIFKRFCVGK